MTSGRQLAPSEWRREVLVEIERRCDAEARDEAAFAMANHPRLFRNFMDEHFPIDGGWGPRPVAALPDDLRNYEAK